MSTLSLEVTDEENVRRVVKEVEAITGGKLDILVNNAYVLFYPESLLTDPKKQRRKLHHSSLRSRHARRPQRFRNKFLRCRQHNPNLHSPPPRDSLLSNPKHRLRSSYRPCPLWLNIQCVQSRSPCILQYPPPRTRTL